MLGYARGQARGVGVAAGHDTDKSSFHREAVVHRSLATARLPYSHRINAYYAMRSVFRYRLHTAFSSRPKRRLPSCIQTSPSSVASPSAILALCHAYYLYSRSNSAQHTVRPTDRPQLAVTALASAGTFRGELPSCGRPWPITRSAPSKPRNEVRAKASRCVSRDLPMSITRTCGGRRIL